MTTTTTATTTVKTIVHCEENNNNNNNHINIMDFDTTTTVTVTSSSSSLSSMKQRCKFDYIFFDWKGTLACPRTGSPVEKVEDRIKKLQCGFSEYSSLFSSVDVNDLDQFRKVYQDVHAKLTLERGVGCYNWTQFLEHLWVALGDNNFTNNKHKNVVIPEIAAEFFDGDVELYRGAVNILNLLKQHDIPIGLIRNSKIPVHQMRKKLAKVDVDSFFTVVVMAGDAGYQKPNREVFELAVKEANIERLHQENPERILFIGNETDLDIVGANGVGWTSVLVCHTEDSSNGLAKFDISNLAELEKIIFE